MDEKVGYAWEARMSKTQTLPIVALTTSEREYIRRELGMFFSTLPTVVAGFQLKTYHGGAEAEAEDLAGCQGASETGADALDAGQGLPWLFFTEAGQAALRAMMTDRRFADPTRFAHVREELGI